MTISVFTTTTPLDSSPSSPLFQTEQIKASFRLKLQKSNSHLILEPVCLALVWWLPDLWSQLPGVWITSIVCWETSWSVLGERETTRILFITMEFQSTIQYYHCKGKKRLTTANQTIVRALFEVFHLRVSSSFTFHHLDTWQVNMTRGLTQCPSPANLNPWPNRHQYRSAALLVWNWRIHWTQREKEFSLLLWYIKYSGRDIYSKPVFTIFTMAG